MGRTPTDDVAPGQDDMHDAAQGTTNPYDPYRRHGELPVLMLRSASPVPVTAGDSVTHTPSRTHTVVFLHHFDTIDDVETSWLRAT